MCLKMQGVCCFQQQGKQVQKTRISALGIKIWCIKLAQNQLHKKLESVVRKRT